MEDFQGSKSDFRIPSGLIHLLNKVSYSGTNLMNSILISMRINKLDVHILYIIHVYMYLQHFTIQKRLN